MPLLKNGVTAWTHATGPLPPAAAVRDHKAWLAKDWHKGVVRTSGDTSVTVKWYKTRFVTEESPVDVLAEAPSHLVATAFSVRARFPPPPRRA